MEQTSVGPVNDKEKSLVKALEENEERFSHLLASTTDYSFTVDLENGRWLHTKHGPGSLAVTGYNADEYIADNQLWFRVIHEADREAVLGHVSAILEGATPLPLDHRVFHKDGSLRWLRHSSVPRKDLEGRVIGYDGLLSDITKLKQAEEQVQQIQAQLAEAQNALSAALADLHSSRKDHKQTEVELIQADKLESVGSLAAGVAHEVKNPLQTILLGVTYLANNIQFKDENTVITLDAMHEALKRANDILHKLLQFATVKDPQIKPEDVNTVVELALRVMNYQIDAAKISLHRDLAANLPRVNMDQNMIEHVLVNLFANAVQAMSPGGVLMVKTYLGPGPSPDHVVIEIRDTGPGISEANLPKVFDAFFTTKPRGIGTGLGLPVVKRIVNLHGGSIEIENVLPHGVLVTLLLKGLSRQGTPML